MHVDKLTRYQPDFGVALASWIEDDNGPRHRATQTDENVEETFGANVLKKEGKKHGDGGEKAGNEQTADTADQKKSTADSADQRKSTGKHAADQQKQPADTADQKMILSCMG